MIIRFSTANHLSFRDRVNLTFDAGAIKEHKESNVFSVTSSGYEFKLLKSVGIFGENASGKSNLIKSFAFMQHFVQNSGNQSLDKVFIDIQSFRLSSATEKNPSLF